MWCSQFCTARLAKTARCKVLLELAGLPYVGAGVLASAVGMDKDVQKRLFEQAGLPIVPFLAVRRSEWEHERAKVLRAIKKKFRFPIFVKPATLGSSVGMTRVKAGHEISAAMDLAAEFATEDHRRARSERPRN